MEPLVRTRTSSGPSSSAAASSAREVSGRLDRRVGDGLADVGAAPSERCREGRVRDVTVGDQDAGSRLDRQLRGERRAVGGGGDEDPGDAGRAEDDGGRVAHGGPPVRGWIDAGARHRVERRRGGVGAGDHDRRSGRRRADRLVQVAARGNPADLDRRHVDGIHAGGGEGAQERPGLALGTRDERSWPASQRNDLARQPRGELAAVGGRGGAANPAHGHARDERTRLREPRALGRCHQLEAIAPDGPGDPDR